MKLRTCSFLVKNLAVYFKHVLNVGKMSKTCSSDSFFRNKFKNHSYKTKGINCFLVFYIYRCPVKCVCLASLVARSQQNMAKQTKCVLVSYMNLFGYELHKKSVEGKILMLEFTFVLQPIVRH